MKNQKFIIGGILAIFVIGMLASGCLNGEMNEEDYLAFSKESGIKSLDLTVQYAQALYPDPGEEYSATIVEFMRLKEEHIKLKEEWDAITPPSKYKEYHYHISRAHGYKIESLDLNIEGISNLDPSLIEEATTKVELAGAEVKEANKELDKINTESEVS